jgi:hypothetical protein
VPSHAGIVTLVEKANAFLANNALTDALTPLLAAAAMASKIQDSLLGPVRAKITEIQSILAQQKNVRPSDSPSAP